MMDTEPENTEPAHLRATRSDRGFKFMPALAGQFVGESVQVYESSLATEPSIWLRVNAQLDRNRPSLDHRNEAIIELSIYVVQDLRDQLDWLLANHYQVHTDG